VDTALRLDRGVHHAKDLETLFQRSDYITIHVPYNASTKDTIDAEAINKMKGNVRIINLARGELVNNDDIIDALNKGRVACYVTDFPNNALLEAKNVIAFPHLGASTPESEENCAVMAAKELKDYLENGNITNSVNLPNLTMERSGVARVCVIHRNVPSMLANIMGVLSKDGINIEHMTNKSRGDYAYTVLDVDTLIDDEVRREMKAIENVIRVRILQQH
jgi:D-3-phosphoglycerate dehydrogenase